MELVVVHWQGRLAWATAVASLYMAEAGLLAGLELVVRLVLVLVRILQEVQSQGQRGWMRKIGVDHNTLSVKVLRPLMYDLYKMLGRVLEGDEGVFIDNKDD